MLEISEEDHHVPDIIDNQTVFLSEEIKYLLTRTKTAKFATGYFYLSGFDLVQENLQHIDKLYLIMGMETDSPTRDEIKLGYKPNEIYKPPTEPVSPESLKVEIEHRMIKEMEGIKKEDQLPKIKALHDLILDHKIEVRIYTKEKFHSKMYLFHCKNYPNTVIVGSSNFTAAGLTRNTELNMVRMGDLDPKNYDEWFHRQWDDSEPFDEKLLKIIEDSKPYKGYIRKVKDAKEKAETPYTYLTPIEYFKYLVKFTNKEYLLERDDILLPFQQLDYNLCRDVINRFGSVILANSVGLGKSYVAAKLLKDYFEESLSILLIIPPNLRDQWKDYLDLFDVEIGDDNILSMYEISQKEFPETKFKEYDVILIDESHNFRNEGSQRWKNFMTRIKNNRAKIILLTATPINNSLRDLNSQVKMMENELFRNENLINFYKSLKDYAQDEDPKHLPDIKELRKKLIVRTTRRDLKRLYNEIIIPGGGEVGIKDPILLAEEGKYSLTGIAYEELFDNLIPNFIDILNVPHLRILNPDSGVKLEGLYKILLYKRLESSIFAFYRSINNLQKKERQLRELLQHKSITEIRDMEKKAYLKELYGEEIDEEFDPLVTTTETEESTSPPTDEEAEKQLYLDQITQDIDTIGKLLGILNKLKKAEKRFSDDKLDVLKRFLSEHPTHKILLFTQFTDTATYLFDNLDLLNTPTYPIHVVSGETKHKLVEAIRFSPGSYSKEMKEKLEKKLGITITPPYTKLLITTDTLSEGVNLQEADFIINYDLPWNPVRLIQRIGRVHRIGNPKDVNVINFVPDEKIDKEMALIDTLKQKIENIIEIIGAEHSLLSIEELEKIKTKELEDVPLITAKRDLIRKMELDRLEEDEARSKLGALDKYLIKVIEATAIRKDDVKKLNLVEKKPYYTLLEYTETNLFYLYTMQLEDLKQIGYLLENDKQEFQDDTIPHVLTFISPRHYLVESEITQIKAFSATKLPTIQQNRQESQHDSFDEKTEEQKKKITRPLQVYSSTRAFTKKDTEFKEWIKPKVAIIDRLHISPVYKTDLQFFFKKWIKEEQYIKDREKFKRDMDTFIDKISKASEIVVDAAQIKMNLSTFIVYIPPHDM